MLDYSKSSGKYSDTFGAFSDLYLGNLAGYKADSLYNHNLAESLITLGQGCVYTPGIETPTGFWAPSSLPGNINTLSGIKTYWELGGYGKVGSTNIYPKYKYIALSLKPNPVKDPITDKYEDDYEILFATSAPNIFINQTATGNMTFGYYSTGCAYNKNDIKIGSKNNSNYRKNTVGINTELAGKSSWVIYNLDDIVIYTHPLATNQIKKDIGTLVTMKNYVGSHTKDYIDYRQTIADYNVKIQALKDSLSGKMLS
jgi:hypothetical protein